MNKAEFERRFDAAFEAAAQNAVSAPVADYRPSWERMQGKLRSRRKSGRARAALGRLAILAAAILIGAFIFNGSSTVRAIEPMYAKLIQSDGMLSFFFGRDEDRDTSGAKTAPPPDYVSGDTQAHPSAYNRTEVTDIEGARDALSFRAPEFGYIPDYFSLYSAELTYSRNQDRADSVIYTYLNGSNGYYVTLYFNKLKGVTGTGTNISGEGITVREVHLRDADGVLTTVTDGTSQLELIAGDIQISFGGRVPADELLRIYDEMKL
ncbi:DUF4367 domain-containing protein [Cohnella sp. GCM10027633]|uniref:DUF4367 domain-containing protein n=1 Tax=unclassified Cohnella TaxID=2636738 RepID=UPI0036326007